MSLGVFGFGNDDALIHLLNFVWPNIFEVCSGGSFPVGLYASRSLTYLYQTSPHVINAAMDAVNGLRVALGPSKILSYTLQGLFHPARKVREVYWKIYNNLYISHQDALVAHYPAVPDDETLRNSFARVQLEYVL
jgi:splicing factor 3B subunit 1